MFFEEKDISLPRHSGNMSCTDFPGGQVLRPLCSSTARGAGLGPGWRTKILHAPQVWPKKKKEIKLFLKIWDTVRQESLGSECQYDSFGLFLFSSWIPVFGGWTGAGRGGLFSCGRSRHSWETSLKNWKALQRDVRGLYIASLELSFCGSEAVILSLTLVGRNHPQSPR